MKVKDILDWGDRLAKRTLALELPDGTEIYVGRLTLQDSILIDQLTGRNPLLELMDVQGVQAGLYPPYDFELQRLIFYCGLRKYYPEITVEEAGDILALFPIDKQAEIVAWIISGSERIERPIFYTRGGKPILRVDTLLPLLCHLYPGYKISDLLDVDATELALLIAGQSEIIKFHVLLSGFAKKKPKLAQPLAYLYNETGGKDDQGRELEKRARKGKKRAETV